VTSEQKRRAAAVDEFGELERQRAEFAPSAARHAALREEIASWVADEPPDQEFVFEGQRYLVHVGPKTLEREIRDMPRLFKILGLKRFLALCRFPLAAIDQHVPPAEHPAVVRQDHTGSRKVKAVAKPLPFPPGKRAA
jgi:hypothetical protein